MAYIEKKSDNAIPVDTNVLTKEGWRQLIDVKRGTLVATSNGEFREVKRIFKQGYQEIFLVRFSDGSFIQTTENFKFVCQSEYEWNHKKKYKSFYLGDEIPPSERTVGEISKKVRGRGGRVNYRLCEDIEAIEWPERLHVVQPYTIGALIARGIFNEGVRLTVRNDTMIKNINKELPYGISSYSKKNVLVIRNANPGLYTKNVVFRECVNLGLVDNKVYQKHIPEEYLFDSIKNRKNLLRGLMDSFGYKYGDKMQFNTTSFQLAEDFTFLVQSLGGIVNRKEARSKNRKMYKLFIKLKFNPFSQKNKRPIEPTNFFKTFKSIDFIGEKICRSLGFSEPSTYITENFILVKSDTIYG